jgi:hypothetical protein
MRKLPLLLLAAALSGCMTMGRPFDVGRVPQIQLNKTTEKDLKTMFGEPYRTGLEDGAPTATWVNYKVWLFGTEQTRDLYVKFNDDGTVRSYSFNTNMPEDHDALKK